MLHTKPFYIVGQIVGECQPQFLPLPRIEKEEEARLEEENVNPRCSSLPSPPYFFFGLLQSREWKKVWTQVG